MGLFDFLNTKKSGPVKFSERFNSLFLQRLGKVSSYEDDNRTYIEQGYQKNPIVYAITQNIVKNASRVRWYIKDKDGNEVTVPLLSDLMKRPNVMQSWQDFIQDALTHKILEGNSFVTGEFGRGVNSDKYNTLYSIPSEDIQIIATNDFRGIQGYKLDFAWAEDTMIPATDVLHLRNPNPDFDETDNWLFGQSSFRAAKKSIQAYNESLDAGVWYLANKGAQKILTYKEDYELPPEAEDALKSKLRAQAQGTKNNGNIPIIDGDFDVVDISSNAADLLVLEQRDQAAMEICNVIGFPSQLIGLNNATYQNAKEAKKGLWETCIIPELDELAAGFNRWLAPQFGEYTICYDTSSIDALQEDKLMRGKAITAFAGMVTINEARKMAGLPPMAEGGDELYVGFTQAVVNQDEEPSGDSEESKYNDWWDNTGD